MRVIHHAVVGGNYKSTTINNNNDNRNEVFIKWEPLTEKLK